MLQSVQADNLRTVNFFIFFSDLFLFLWRSALALCLCLSLSLSLPLCSALSLSPNTTTGELTER